MNTYLAMWLFGLTSGLALSALFILLGRWRSADLREELQQLARAFRLHRAHTNERLAVLEGRHTVVPDANRPFDGPNVALEAEQARRRLSDWLATQPTLAVKYATATPANGTPYPRLPGTKDRTPAKECLAYRRQNLTVTCPDPGCARCAAMTAPIVDPGTPIHDELTQTPESGIESQDDHWEDALIAAVPVPAVNPHYGCGTVNSPPCPTGEHQKPTHRLSKYGDSDVIACDTAEAYVDGDATAWASGNGPITCEACDGDITDLWLTLHHVEVRP